MTPTTSKMEWSARTPASSAKRVIWRCHSKLCLCPRSVCRAVTRTSPWAGLETGSGVALLPTASRAAGDTGHFCTRGQRTRVAISCGGAWRASGPASSTVLPSVAGDVYFRSLERARLPQDRLVRVHGLCADARSAGDYESHSVRWFGYHWD